MTLVLTITNVERLDNGVSTRLTLDRHGAVIGRSPSADWSLPDPRAYISSTHCEIDFRGGAYLLVDKSTNGTFLNGAASRLSSPHTLAHGDVLSIGHYEIRASLEGEGAPAPAPTPAPAPAWGGWNAGAPAAAPNVDPAAWDRPPPGPAISGQGPMSQHWSPPKVEPAAPASGGWAPPPQAQARPAPEADNSVWAAPAPAPERASGWSSPVPDGPQASAPSDVWSRLAEGNVVDWARGGFGAAPAAPAGQQLGLDRPSESMGDPFGLGAPQPSPAVAPPQAGDGPPAAAPAAAAPARPAAPSPAAASAIGGFLAAAGLTPDDLKAPPQEALATAGALLTKLVAGLVVMLEARARAKAQLGAQGTSLEFAGNNPLKFARAPGKAVAQLLNPAERGFMDADLAVEDAFRDLQAHQMATLAAMQGALAATLARFSPEAIRSRAETRGILAKIIPSARDAALWEAYEREFEGVARGSDEAFMDVFAKEFRDAYEKAAQDLKQKA
ncbi:MAG TPA: type VI secretion system-associated FHA domain protein TagH [Phenylobacterium sp.]|nr:type VI secretion system-associated FHA domain protein TagH [Phenylobacterium sp.]